MGFSLPKITIPSIPFPDINSEISKLTKAFDPTASVNQMASNVLNQQAATETVRANLEKIRKQSQLDMANTDFNALKSYTTGLQGQVDTACVMSSVKPAFTPMTPTSISNPLASDVLSSTTGKLTGESLRDTLLANTGNLVAIAEKAGVVPADQLPMYRNVVKGDVSNLTSAEGLSNLAVTGAGIYASSLTGGLVPPSACSTVIENVAGNAVQTGVAGALSGDPTAALDAVSKINTNVDMGAMSKTIASDYTGTMAEGVISNALNSAIKDVAPSGWENMTQQAVQQLGDEILNTINPEGYTGTVGGVNYGDASAVTAGVSIQALQQAANRGDVAQMQEHSKALVDSGVVAAKSLYPIIDEAASNVTQTPKNIEQYQDLHATLAEAANVTPDPATSGIAKAGGRLSAVVNGVDQQKKNAAIADVVTQLKNKPNTIAAMV